MRQKLSLLIAVLSAIASLVVGGLWLRGRTLGDKWFVQHIVPGKSQSVSHIEVTPTELAVENDWRPEFPGTTAEQLAWEVDSAGWQVQHSRTSDDIYFPGLRNAGRAGFAWARNDTKFADSTGKVVGADTYRGLLLPLWALLVASVLPAALVTGRWLIGSWVRRRRRRCNRCERCGYDLRGGSGVNCPECGHAVGSRRVAPTVAT